ncbi:26S proteasome non-ATPase regulatory subunit 9 [Escovopsis weberi]|uniref:26S proteasome non-ATPase regulatory subunit 9 n=1 Tax=Escovopsis weberi TaxID=150374 RepID=A0A0M9VRL2_ESCWE|nr:26S proteasome non-ATPase regulatory subunit 9 [Escovopsis weberi]
MEEGLHAPTVPSGPTSSVVTNGVTGRMGFAELQQKKDVLEAELKTLGGVLDSHGVDMDTPLLTGDGFPRADLDVAQIRTTRARIIRLRNDYKELMSAIEKYLHDHFASIRDGDGDGSAAGQPASGGGGSSILPDSLPEALEMSFAKVNTVAAGSPADQAGLKTGDEIRNFGYVNYSNHDDLRKVVECVQGNEGCLDRMGWRTVKSCG